MTLLADGPVEVELDLTEGRTVPTHPDRAGQTVRRMVLGNVAALLVLIVAGYALGARLAEQQALRDASRLARFVGEAVVAPHITDDLLAGEPQAVAALDTTFERHLEPLTSIARMKVWAPDGTVVYSDEHREIGQHFTLSAAQEALLHGGPTVTAEVSELDAEENTDDRLLGPHSLETYTLLADTEAGPVLFEAYIDYDELQSRRGVVFHALAQLAALLVGVALVAQAWLARLNLQWLRRKQAELDRTAAAADDGARRRVARDLHDGAVQELTGLSFLVDGARASLRSGEGLEPAQRSLDLASTTIGSALNSLRTTIVEVYPPVLVDRGLDAALEDLVQPLRSRGLQVVVDVGGEELLDPGTVTACYRAAQELLRNVSRHARATRVWVTVRVVAGVLRLSIRDDGAGVATDRLRTVPVADGHLGLTALADAALERQGRMTVRTGPGGTEIVWEVRT